MYTSRLINLFTTVTIISTLSSFQAQALTDAEKANLRAKYKTFENCATQFNLREEDINKCKTQHANPPPVSGSGGNSIIYDPQGQIKECQKLARENECRSLGFQDTSDRAECNTLLRDLQNDEEAAIEKCSELGFGDDVQSCISKTEDCRNNTDINSNNSDDPDAAMTNLMRTWTMSQSLANATSGSDPTGCRMIDQDRERERKEKIEEKIAKLLEENEESEVKKAELDEEVAKRQEEVEDKIREAEEEYNRKKIERQTKKQEEESRIQKAILEAQKKQYATLRQIDDKNTEIGNLQFAQQQTNIEFAKSAIDRKCEVAAKAKEKELTSPAPAVAGSNAQAKPQKMRFSRKDSIKIRSEIDRVFKECLDLQNLGKKAQLKGLIDKRVKLQADIDTLNRSIEDEQKAIALDQKAFEDLKGTMSAEEQTELENKFKKLNTLSESLAKFKESIQKKKASQDKRMLVRKERIERLIASKADVIYKESKIARPIKAYQNARSSFVNQCCGTDADPKFKNLCGDINKGAPKKGKSSTTTSTTN
jgi:hypothetical protein